MSFQTAIDLANTPAFKEKVQIAICEAAISVQAEDETGLSIPAGSTLTEQQLHDKRSEFAYAVLRNPSGYADLFKYGVVTSVSISGASSDADILFTVNSMWNAYAINGANA